MRKAIKPHVRKDGVTFVDKEHFINGSPIKSWECTRKSCGFLTTEVCWGDADWGEVEKGSKNKAHAEATGGFYGPNGNGYNYWCPKCEHRMNPRAKA